MKVKSYLHALFLKAKNRKPENQKIFFLFGLTSFLGRLDKVQEELLHYFRHWRWQWHRRPHLR